MGSAGQSTAVSSDGEYSIQFTLGETFIQTKSSPTGDFIITQGYNQPEYGPIATPLVVKFSIDSASCYSYTDGSITIDTILGCSEGYLVYFNDELTDSLHFGNLEASDYNIRIEADGGCTLDTTITIEILGKNCGIHFYNAFSPNNDGVNDVWIIPFIETEPNNSVQIFDRWGNIVFDKKGYNNLDVVWDGRAGNTKTVPDGTYYFIVFINEDRFHNPNGKGDWVEVTR